LKTPTACAAALVEQVNVFRSEVERVWSGIDRHAGRALHQATAGLSALTRGVHRATISAVERSDARLSHRRQRVGAVAERAVERASNRLTTAAAGLRRVPARLDSEARQLEAIAARTRLLDPIHTLSRGWSITRTPHGGVVRDARDLAEGSTIVTTFAHGTSTSRVEEIT
jgi:exodeoxyribonuclease VII large subunit